LKRGWQKQTCIKIKDPTLHNNVLQELGNIMYDNDGPSKANVKLWAMNRLQYITTLKEILSFATKRFVTTNPK
jgi:hypothetical protein